MYDKQKNGLIKQYPIVSNAFNSFVQYSGNYGIITDFSYSDIQPILGTRAQLNEMYGGPNSIPAEGLIKFYYIRRHAKVTDINTDLNIDELLEQPLVHYIVGMALRDNQDTQSRAMAAEELQIYYQMLSEYSIQKSKAFSQVGFSTRYRPND